MGKLVDVMLAVNDANGNQTGQVVMIEIGDELMKLQGESAFKLLEVTFRIDEEPFVWHSYNYHVGNIHWDCATVLPSTAARLANYLRSKDWQLEDAEIKIWEKWEGGELFTKEDFYE